MLKTSSFLLHSEQVKLSLSQKYMYFFWYCTNQCLKAQNKGRINNEQAQHARQSLAELVWVLLKTKCTVGYNMTAFRFEAVGLICRSQVIVSPIQKVS